MDGIAIIGMSGRFPGANSVAAFWDNLVRGVESISRFTDAELEMRPPMDAAGAFVNARGVIEDADAFDAGFFGCNAREAELLDPQHRIFVECAWEALESAGVDPARYPGLIGVWAGSGINSYLLYNIATGHEYLAQLVGGYQQGESPAQFSNDRDFLATRVAYKLDLKGPAITVQTACSTSLVAVAQACQALWSYSTDAALAGGVSISFPQRRGYVYQEGAIGSADGRVRTFDAAAQGTVFSSGAGVVCLKRLADAQADGDPIIAVIRGAATNNDGANKVSFSAPSVEGQAEVIQLAQALAGVEPATVGFVEAHGTGTPLGDPIEVAALTQAFRAGGAAAKNFCALGSLKTNVGHLDIASGVAALIKTAQVLGHRVLPPTLHFQTPNPHLGLADSPFYVNTEALPWPAPADGTPRRAGVSSFGVGGTNAHAVLEEAPPLPSSAPSARKWQLFVLSAKTATALEQSTENLVRHLRAEPALDAADAAWTLQTGRRAWSHRRVVAARSLEDAAAALSGRDARRVFSRADARSDAPVAFLFAGQGAQVVGMGAGLYRTEPAFRAEIDRCAEILRPFLDGTDLRSVLYPEAGKEAEAALRLNETRFTQPALFVFGYALARLWMSWGVQPAAMLGHSVGEYVAACVAGVFSLEDALRLVAARAGLVQAQPGGSMLAVRLAETDLQPLLPAAGLEIAAVNSTGLCVVSGADAAVAAFEEEMAARRVAARRLKTSHAFHSAMMDPVVEPFAALVREIALQAPAIPFVSNVSGRWITAEEATDPAYWARHLRAAVRFADGAGELLRADAGYVLLEAGPGQTLAPLVRQVPAAAGRTILSSLQEGGDDTEAISTTLGRLWLEGVAVDWAGYQAGATRRRVALPTYPFERQRYWIEPPAAPAASIPGRDTSPTHSPDLPGIVPSAPARTEDPGSASERHPYLADAAAGAAGSASPPRVETLRDRIRVILKNLSGQDHATADADATLLELGFDSLFLTQVAGAFRKEFGVKITFRQLLEDLVTINALAAHLDAQLPPEAPKPAAGTVVSIPAPFAPAAVGAPVAAASLAISSTAPSDNTTLERVIQEQLRVMAEQLAMLRGDIPAVPECTATVTTSLPAPPTSLPAKIEAKAFGPYRPIEKGAGGGFTERQQRHLDALIARYVARTPGSKRQTQENRAHFSDPRTVSSFRQSWKEMVYPVIVERSAGSRFWDIDGNEFVDVTMGFGTNLLGHNPPFIKEALEAQLQRGIEVGPTTPLAGKVAKLLCELTGSERAAFTNTGSEAVLAAVRLARTVTGRTRIATTGGFHGINDEVLVRAGLVDGQRRGMPVAPGIPDHIVKDVVVADYGTAEGLELLRAHAHELAAVLVEPVQSRRPDLQPREFLHALREITTQAGCVLIFDEVITGFRCHLGGAQAYFGVQADLATWGKVMGGGMPVGAVTGKAEYMDALDGGNWQYGDGSFPEVGVTFFAGTYIRHPLTMAASWAILNHLKREGGGLQRRLTERTAAMVFELNRFFADSGVPLRLENFASVFYPRFDDEIKYGSLLYFHLREKGVHIWEGRPCFLSTAHSEADVEFIVAAFKESVREMQEGGFLPGEPKADEAPRAALVPLLARRPAVVPDTTVLNGTDLARRTSSNLDAPAKPLAFSLYYFGNYPAAFHEDKYRLILESARFADQHGFAAVWLPERHFHAVGGFSPNPSLLAAALARDTERIALRGGSVVLPLHHPVRVAEEWSLVDNLSHGRVGISIATGWHPNDFVFAPERFERRREICLEDIATIQKLWRGESLPMRAGAGADFDVTLFPLPVQPKLPVWLTCIHEESFVRAGELGVGVLGYLMNQTVDEVAAKIAKYRVALAAHGHDPGKGHVTILVHTFVGEDAEAARQRARGPLREYLRSYLDNSQKRFDGQDDAADVSAEDIEYLLDRAFDDYVRGKAFIGSPESCAAVADRLREIGVDEVGCFIDFGVDPQAVLASLPALDRLRENCNATPAPPPTERTVPLTEAQSGMWTLGHTDAYALRAYQESTTLEFRGPLDVEALRRALQAGVQRHEALRALVRPDADAQVILPNMPVRVPLVDLAGSTECLADTLQGIERMQFDFEHGPLLRAVVVQIEPERHLLMLTFHHLFGNGPSYWVFFEDLCALYEAERTGRPATLPPAMQLSDFVHWRAAEAGRTEADDEQFWLAQFEGSAPVLELPADRPRPAVRTHRGTGVAITLPKELTTALRKMAAARRGSLFMTLLAAFETLLHRLSGQDDLTVGAAYESEVRAEPGGDRLFANTTNVLPLRSRAGANMTFAELLTATKDVVLAAGDHQNYFFGRLLKKLGVRPNPSRPPLFSVFFNYESGKFQRDLGGGLAVELLTEDVPYRNPHDTAMFELHLNVAEQDGALLCECDYSTDLYDAGTVERWMGHYRTLLEAIVRNPDEPVWTLPLLDEGEQQQILRDWNGIDGSDANTTAVTLTGLFAAQVERTPDAPALIFEGETLTYRQLDVRANRLAHFLRRHNVGRETLVALCLERSVEMLVAMWGVLKAGAAYVPLDPDYPAERLAFMLADAGAPVLLTQERLTARLPASDARVIRLDTDWPEIAAESVADPRAEITPDQLAYVIYTSGSTGRPKGALLTHRNVSNCMRWVADTYGFGPGERILQKTPFSFDLSVPEFLAPVIAGAAIVMARPGMHADSDYLATTIAKQGVTFTHFVPSMLALFLEEKNLPARCQTLRWVCCNGEPLPWETTRRFYDVFRDSRVELHNLYGPTETAVQVTAGPCPREDADADRVVPIGRPLPNTQIYLLDPRGQPVPVGVPGELHIGGVQVGRGYLNRPELTAEKFVADPFAGRAGVRLYRTGDLARWLPDGRLVCLGRLDHQVKVRGFRIELGEIEAVLAQQPRVKENVVLVREDRPGDRRLVAYVAAAPEDRDRLAARLRAAVRTALPEYMLPAAFVVLERLPLSPNGKVDRRALPPPDFSAREETAAGSVEPRDEWEARLAGIWQTVLGLERVGVHDNFFELGGDSLLGLRTINRLRDLLGGQALSLVAIFEAPTVAGLAASLQKDHPAAVARALGGSVDIPAAAAIDQGGTATPLPSIVAVSRDARRTRRSSLAGDRN